MTTIDRKAAKAAYKERKSVAGTYAVRCVPSGQVWVGAAPNLDTIQNRIWFSLRHGNSSFPTLQAAWNEHGAESFTFEELERLDEDVNPYRRKDLLKERAASWQESLQAQAI
jgi:hypothetical protein